MKEHRRLLIAVHDIIEELVLSQLALQEAIVEALCSLEEEISINQDDGGSSEDGP